MHIIIVKTKNKTFKLIKDVDNLKKEKNELANHIQLAFFQFFQL